MRFLISSLTVLLSLLLVAETPAQAKSNDFAAWKQQFANRLRKEGLAEPAIALFLGSANYLSAPIQAQNRQPEKILTFGAYRRNLLTDARISEGQEFLRDYRPYYEQLAKTYGVEPQLFIALWGIESSYGRSMGRHQLISSLASLAYAGKRQEFFEKQLVAAVRIAASGDIPVERMTGSWAGAMGHYQFIPTTFESFAVDGDGDGRRDLCGSYADAAASAGNYLQKLGWQAGDLWIAPLDQPRAVMDKRIRVGFQPARYWVQAGLLPPADYRQTARFKIVAADEGRSGYFLVAEGFDRLKEWNRSTYFALSVMLLSKEVATGAGADAP